MDRERIKKAMNHHQYMIRKLKKQIARRRKELNRRKGQLTFLEEQLRSHR